MMYFNTTDADKASVVSNHTVSNLHRMPASVRCATIDHVTRHSIVPQRSSSIDPSRMSDATRSSRPRAGIKVLLIIVAGSTVTCGCHAHAPLRTVEHWSHHRSIARNAPTCPIAAAWTIPRAAVGHLRLVNNALTIAAGSTHHHMSVTFQTL